MMNLPDVSDPHILTLNLQSNDEKLVHRTLYALDKKFRSKFKIQGKSICKRWPVTKNREDELIDVAYSEGLYCFFKKIQKDGFEANGVGVEYVFNLFFRNVLHGQLKKLYRESSRMTEDDPDKVFEILENSITQQPDCENEEYTRKQALFDKAYHLLKANCRNLIEFRKLLRLKNEEIALRLGLQANSVNNEVYKCMGHLKKTIENMGVKTNPLYNQY
ncbi:MAG: hypothetical protein JWQ66_156 [Mucilaginibacter sp.]|nr:hypothetical protein [Mucilaginibacter sp.]